MKLLSPEPQPDPRWAAFWTLIWKEIERLNEADRHEQNDVIRE